MLAGASPLGTAHPNAVAQVGATIQASAADSIEVAAIDRQVRGVHDETWGFQLGYDHLISKRTTLYARAGYLKNIGTAVVSWPGYAAPAGSSQTMALVGITHRF